MVWIKQHCDLELNAQSSNVFLSPPNVTPKLHKLFTKNVFNLSLLYTRPTANGFFSTLFTLIPAYNVITFHIRPLFVVFLRFTFLIFIKMKKEE